MNPNIDWSKSPKDATHWMMTELGKSVWAREVTLGNGLEAPIQGLVSCRDDYDYAPDFGYEGRWQDSLTQRPECEEMS